MMALGDLKEVGFLHHPDKPGACSQSKLTAFAMHTSAAPVDGGVERMMVLLVRRTGSPIRCL